VPILIGGIVTVLVLGIGGLQAVRIRGMIEVHRAYRQATADLTPEQRSHRRRRMTIALSCIAGWYAVAGGLFALGHHLSGVRLGAGLDVAWLLLSFGVGFPLGIWWDIRHGNL
jgi:hypothetical protein